MSDEPGTFTVFLVDDDPSVLRSVSRLIRSANWNVLTFSSARDFLERRSPDAPGCLLLDVAMPGMSGLELQQLLASDGLELPIVFLTGQGDIPQSVRAMRLGAVDFLTKPCRDEDLFAAVDRAMARDKSARANRAEQAARGRRLARLTPRERQVMLGVVAGKLNKQIAADLGTAEKTVKVQRSRVMEKLEVRSVADLVRLVERANPT